MPEQQIQLQPIHDLLLSDTATEHDDAHNPHIFNNYFEYMMTLIGFTVGFGSFWRFPYLIYKNGGGVFLIPYLLAIMIVGVPLLYLQTALGQIHRVSFPFIVAKIHPAMKFIGIAMLLSSVHMSSIYNIILVYSYRFVFSSLNPVLGFTDELITQNTYFKETVLEQSTSISDFGGINPVLFVLYVSSLLVCHMIVKNGVKQSGKVVVVTALLPFVFLLLLLVRGLFLDGVSDGLAYLFKPKWEKLFTWSIWVDALVQVFYQLSIAMGAIVNMSSMKPLRQPFLKGVYILPSGILLCGLLSSLNIFVYLGHFCKEIGFRLDDPALHLSGPELSFNVFPKALALLPLPNLWILLFFISMVFLGIDSQFTLIESAYCYLKDQFRTPWQVFGIDITIQRAKIIHLCVIMLGSPTLASHAGIYYLQFYDLFTTNIPYTLGAVIEVYMFVHLFPFYELETQVVKYAQESTPAWIRFLIQSKLMMGILSVNFAIAVVNQIRAAKDYSWKYYAFGWVLSFYPFIISIVYFKHFYRGQPLKLTFKEIKARQSYF